MSKKGKQKRPLETRAAGRPVDVSTYTATDGRDILLNTPDGWEVDAPWLWWLGPDLDGGGGGPWGNPPPGAGDFEWTSSLPAVTRCTELICETIAGLPWEVHRYRDQNRTDVLAAIDVIPAPDWVSDPQGKRADARIMAAGTVDANMSGVAFWTNFLVSALWWGDAYIYVPARAVDGSPRPPIYQLHPAEVSIVDGRYQVADVTMAAGSIIHMPGKPPYWHGHGHGVLKRHCVDLGLALTIRSYTAGAYRSGVPAGYLKSTQPHMDETDAQALKDAWMRNHGRGRRNIAVLNATTDFTPISVTPIDAALDQARRWSTIDIANMFGVPAYMLGDVGTTGNTYSNAESRALDFVTYTLQPWIDRLESTLGAEFPRGTALRVDTTRLERADTATRIASLKVLLDAGVITADEIRRLENYPTAAELAAPAPVPVPPALPPGGAPGA